MADPIVSNDAAGGAGSIKSALLGVVVNGISRAVDGRLARSYPLGGDQERLDDQGRPAGAPQSTTAQLANNASGLISNPIFIAAAVSVALAVVIVLAVRK